MSLFGQPTLQPQSGAFNFGPLYGIAVPASRTTNDVHLFGDLAPVEPISFHSFTEKPKPLPSMMDLFRLPMRLSRKLVGMIILLIHERQEGSSRLARVPLEFLLPILAVGCGLPRTSPVSHNQLSLDSLPQLWRWLSANLAITRERLAWWSALPDAVTRKPFVLNDLSEINSATIREPAADSLVTKVLSDAVLSPSSSYLIGIREPSAPVHMLKEPCGGSAVVVERLKRRARILRALSDQQSGLMRNTRRFLGITIAESSVTSVYEFMINGKLLSGAWATLDPSPYVRWSQIGTSLCSALALMHSSNEVHGALDEQAVYLFDSSSSAMISYSMDYKKITHPDAKAQDVRNLASLFLSIWACRPLEAPPSPDHYPVSLIRFYTKIQKQPPSIPDFESSAKEVLVECALGTAEAAQIFRLHTPNSSQEFVAAIGKLAIRIESAQLLDSWFPNKAGHLEMLRSFENFLRLFGPLPDWELNALPVALMRNVFFRVKNVPVTFEVSERKHTIDLVKRGTSKYENDTVYTIGRTENPNAAGGREFYFVETRQRGELSALSDTSIVGLLEKATSVFPMLKESLQVVHEIEAEIKKTRQAALSSPPASSSVSIAGGITP